MNDRPCAFCGLPMTGLRSDAKTHPGCRNLLRQAPQEPASKRFWQSIWQMRRATLPVARRRRDRRAGEDDDTT
jgi:hypothetical protein